MAEMFIKTSRAIEIVMARCKLDKETARIMAAQLAAARQREAAEEPCTHAWVTDPMNGPVAWRCAKCGAKNNG